MGYFPTAAVTGHSKPSCLKTARLCLHSAGVRSPTWVSAGENQGVSRAVLLLEVSGGIDFQPFPDSRGARVPWLGLPFCCKARSPATSSVSDPDPLLPCSEDPGSTWPLDHPAQSCISGSLTQSQLCPSPLLPPRSHDSLWNHRVCTPAFTPFWEAPCACCWICSWDLERNVD